MAKFKLIFELCFPLLLLGFGCSSFPTSFEQIDTDKIRVLDFKYQNRSDTTLVDAAPGDSMRLTAFFSGPPIETIRWEIAYSVTGTKSNWIPSVESGKIFNDIHPLEYHQVQSSSGTYTNATQTICFDFKIPDSILYHNTTIPDTIFSSLGITKSQGLTVIDSLSGSAHNKWLTLLFRDTSNQESNKRLIGLTQELSADIGIRATVNNVYIVESSITVRYNRHFEKIVNGVFCNHNPQIRWAGIIKSPGKQKTSLDLTATSMKDTLYLLYSKEKVEFPGTIIINDTIAIDNNHSYFAAVDSGLFNGHDLRDSATAFHQSGTFFKDQETWYAQWFCKHDSLETAGISSEKYAKIPAERVMGMAIGNPITPFYPPLDNRITSATLWVTVFDNFIGERLRPRGSDLVEMNVYFRY
jgi:hypothetical protein